MASSSFPPASIKPLLKDAHKNLLKAIEAEETREDKRNKWQLPTLWKVLMLHEISKIKTLANDTQGNITLTADEYIDIKRWAEWKE